jgi:hypothetical protein
MYCMFNANNHIIMEDKEILTKIYQEYCYGANLSIRMNPLEDRPLLSFGHDECIFQQFIFTERSWRGTSGEQTIIPKGEGYGLMASAFQSRELGFGFELAAEQLNVVNSFGLSVWLHYLETESAWVWQRKGRILDIRLHGTSIQGLC